MSTSCRDCGWQKGGPRPSPAGDEHVCTSPEHCKEEVRDDQFLQEEFTNSGGLWLLARLRSSRFRGRLPTLERELRGD